MKAKHSNITYDCKLCNFKFTRPDSLKNHRCKRYTATTNLHMIRFDQGYINKLLPSYLANKFSSHLLVLNLTLILPSDPKFFPFSCTSLPSCDKMFVSEASEKEHRRSKRCKVFLCDKCGEKTKNIKSMKDHMKICQIYCNVDEEDLADIVIDPQSNSDGDIIDITNFTDMALNMDISENLLTTVNPFAEV